MSVNYYFDVTKVVTEQFTPLYSLQMIIFSRESSVIYNQMVINNRNAFSCCQWNSNK